MLSTDAVRAPLLWVCFVAAFVPRVWAVEQLSHGTVAQAHTDRQPRTFPIVAGTDIRFSRLSSAGGLSLTRVTSILQDDQGFMWFATQHGLSRFDGYGFKVFARDSADPTRLSCTVPSALFRARDGSLWVGCDQFLNRFERGTETFTRYPVPFVLHISQDSAGLLWLSTSTGLFALDPDSGHVRHYSHDSHDPSSLSSDAVAYSGEDREGRFWVAAGTSLDQLDRRTGKVLLRVRVPFPGGFRFYEDRLGILWIYAMSSGAFGLFDRRTNTVTYASFENRGRPSTDITGITTILEDRTGRLWLATHGAGLLRLDRDRQRFIRYAHSPQDLESLPQNNVESLFADREGSIWAGLGRLGLARFSTAASPFQRFSRLDRPDSTVEPFVGAIYEDREGVLWIGTPAALNGIDRNGRYRYYRRRTTQGAANVDVISIVEDHSGELWVGTYGHGLLRLDRRTGLFTTYQHDPADRHSLSSDTVMRLLVDHKGTLWAATAEGLNRFDAATNRFTTYRLGPNRNEFYLELVEDRAGVLWVGSISSGLFRFDPGTGTVTAYEHDMTRPGALSDSRVNSLHFDRSGSLWVGTQDGLNRFDSQSGTFTTYTRRDGLPGNAMGAILDDEQGNLWIGTNNGLARFNPQSRTVTSYAIPDGLPGPDLTGWGTGFRAPNGRMFFGGFSGATAFFPDQVTDALYIPSIVLTDFHLSGNPVEIGSRSLPRSIASTNHLTLSHDQNIFSLTFAALSYANPATNRYRYKLEGLQMEWTEVGSDRRQATYTTLPAGTYTFRVQGATNRGPWSEPGVSLGVEILPPWWATAWFRATVAATLGGLVCVLYRRRLRQVSFAMTAAFDARLAERTRLAHDLHDTLLQTLQASKLVADEALGHSEDHVYVHGALGRVSGWLGQAVLEGRTALNSLRESIAQTNDLADDLRRAIADRFAPASMSVTFTVEGSRQQLHPILRDEVYAIVCEAIRNAFMHSMASRLIVIVQYARDVSVRVSDNGRGMDPEVIASGRIGHFGLKGMRERAARIGATLTIASTPGTGTEAMLIVPGHVLFKGLYSVRRTLLSRCRTSFNWRNIWIQLVLVGSPYF